MFNDSFYPTPEHLSSKMLSKIKGHPRFVLEPSAGKGDLIEAYNKRFDRYKQANIQAIEINEDLQALLRGKGIKVLYSDFLAYSGQDKFDLIIANPPFAHGDLHLLKVIDILYSGQIIFLLNAETIKNPFSNTRKLLAQKLKELNAEIEFISDSFITAERKTNVEVALINIVIDRKIEDDIFVGIEDKAKDKNINIENKYEISTGRTVEEVVAEYNQTINDALNIIQNYYTNYKGVKKFIGISINGTSQTVSGNLTESISTNVNEVTALIRKDFWRKILDLDEVRKRMTEKRRKEFEDGLFKRSHMDFTENNIRSFVLNIIGNYEKTMTDAVVEIFDLMTLRHCYEGGINEKNIHYFNGWKTNKSFKVGKKIVIPIGYNSDAFVSWSGHWKVDYNAERKLNDIDIVMNYFDGMEDYISIAKALDEAFKTGQTSGVKSTYFTATAHKKGTIHLTFNDEKILRRFNVAACKGKGWLPKGYGEHPLNMLSYEDADIVRSFENEKSYNANVGISVFADKNLLKLTS